MNSKENVAHDHIKMSSKDFMNRFVDFFRSNNLLNQVVKVEHSFREYKIYCSEDKFTAYRINPNPGIPPGLPCWITCMVTQEEIIDYSSMGRIDSGDPSVKEWLDCIINGNFKHISEIE